MDDLQIVQKALGRKIKELRSMRNFSQSHVAKLTGMNRAYLSALENGNKNVTLDNLVKIALCLEVSISELFETPSYHSDDFSNSEMVQSLFISNGTFTAIKKFLDTSSFLFASDVVVKGVDLLQKYRRSKREGKENKS